MRAEEGTRPSKTFRIFVSSTFSDLKAERDALRSRKHSPGSKRAIRDGRS